MTRSNRMKLIDAALGKVPCDWVIQGARVLDVFSCKWELRDVGVVDGRICLVEPTGSGIQARETRDGRGKSLVPGFIDAHVHLESSLMVPSNFQATVLPRGTTAAVCDPHELANVQGVSGIRYFLDAAEKLDLDLRVMLSSCVPATHMETNGGGEILAADLLPLRSHRAALGLAEMMNFPGVLHGDPIVHDKLEAFQGGTGPGVRIDGHCPLLRGRELSAYASAGISSCHESSELEEAREKLSKGLAVWVREGSVAKDLDELAPLLSLATSTSIGFCTDDRNPRDILDEGHIDYLIRRALKRSELAPEVAFRAASWSVARHYGLDQGSRRVGAIAPGYLADLVLLEGAGQDVRSVSIQEVFKSGRLAQELSRPSSGRSETANSIRAVTPTEEALQGPEGPVHVIGVLPGKILTERSVERSDASGVARLSVLGRYGTGAPPANGYVRGFGHLTGAIASSVGHDSHNLIVVGSDLGSMRTALASLIRSGGGFCVARGASVLAELALPIGGLMSPDSPSSIRSSLQGLQQASREIGCELSEPFLQLAFLSLPVIPSLKLTDRGLVDVDRFALISVSA